jgi:hypothetical protein
MRIALLLAVSVVLFCARSVGAVTIELSWSPNPEEDLAGYRVYHGIGPTCPAVLPPLLVNGKQVTILKPTTTYKYTAKNVTGEWCFEITAYDSAGNESGRSNRVSKPIDGTPPAKPVLRLGGVPVPAPTP